MKQFKTSLILFSIMSFSLGLIYPLLMTGIAEIAFSKKANGSLININGTIAGSGLIGQNFSGQKYFHGRPSANNYNGASSGGSNYGPTNEKFIEKTGKLAEQVREENGLSKDVKIPSDIVLASGSGLDPHISLKSAFLQVPRIARERKVNASIINDIIKENTETRFFRGDSFVNVLKLNIALDSGFNHK